MNNNRSSKEDKDWAEAMLFKIARTGLGLALVAAIGSASITEAPAVSAQVEGSTTSAPAAGSNMQNERLVIARRKLERLWSHLDAPKRGDCEKIILTFGIDKEDRLNNAQEPECIRVFQSSGSKAMDQYAIVCLKKAFRNSKENLEKGLESFQAIFEIKSKTTSIDYLPEPDFSGYMTELQKRIKHNWVPPKADSTRRIKAAFRIHNDGSVSDMRILNPGIKEADEAAIAAITKASPFNSLPLGAIRPVSINFTFDYNVAGANQILAVKVLNDENFPPLDLSNYIKHLQEHIDGACAREEWKDQTPIRCSLILHKNGTVSNLSFLGAAQSKTREALATKIIRDSKPFEVLPASFDSDLYLMLSFVKSKTVTKEIVSDNYEIDLKISDLPTVKKIAAAQEKTLTASIIPYLSQVENKLTEVWNPPGTSKYTEEQVSFNIDKDGNISKLFLLNVTGDNVADMAILQAVKVSKPFAPLPKNSNGPIQIKLERLSINSREVEKKEQKSPEKTAALSVENDIFRVSASSFTAADQRPNGKVSSEIDWRSFLNHIAWRLRQKLKLPAGPKCGGMVAQFTLQSGGDISELLAQPLPKNGTKDITTQRNLESEEKKEKDCLEAFEKAIKAAAPLWSFPENAPKSIKVECTFRYPIQR